MDNSKFIIEISEKLSQKNIAKLLIMISEISEKSYRRGVQQTIHLKKNNLIDEWIEEDEGYSFRYEKSTRTSIGLDGFTRDSIRCLLDNEPYLHFLEGSQLEVEEE